VDKLSLEKETDIPQTDVEYDFQYSERWFNMFPWTPKTNKTLWHSECGFLITLTSEATHANIRWYSSWICLVYLIFVNSHKDITITF
jgi:hypothetical protein